MAFILHNLWYILGGLAIVVLLAGWWLMSSGALSKVMDSIRPTADKFVRAKLFCDDGQIRDRKLKTEAYCITDTKKESAFHMVRDLMLTGANKGKRFLALTERDDFPIDFLGKLTSAVRAKFSTAQRVYIDTVNDSDSKVAMESSKQIMTLTLGIIAVSGGIVVVVMGIFAFWKGGI